MGLDIRAFKNLKKIDNPVLDRDGYPEDYDNQWLPGSSMDWSESIWKGKGYPVESNCVYEFEDVYSFPAGSYSGYNMWRYTLEGFKGDVAFQELIDFADNEGVIGSVLSQKLYDDFKNNYEEAIKYSKTINDGDWFIRKYEDWMEAFDYARQNGAVNFE